MNLRYLNRAAIAAAALLVFALNSQVQAQRFCGPSYFQAMEDADDALRSRKSEWEDKIEDLEDENRKSDARKELCAMLTWIEQARKNIVQLANDTVTRCRDPNTEYQLKKQRRLLEEAAVERELACEIANKR